MLNQTQSVEVGGCGCLVAKVCGLNPGIGTTYANNMKYEKTKTKKTKSLMKTNCQLFENLHSRPFFHQQFCASDVLLTKSAKIAMKWIMRKVVERKHTQIVLYTASERLLTTDWS